MQGDSDEAIIFGDNAKVGDSNKLTYTNESLDSSEENPHIRGDR